MTSSINMSDLLPLPEFVHSPTERHDFMVRIAKRLAPSYNDIFMTYSSLDDFTNAFMDILELQNSREHT